MASWDEVLDQLVRDRGRALVRYATLLTGDERGAQALVQDALVRGFGRGRPLREVAAAEGRVRQAIRTTFLGGRHPSVRHERPPGPEAGRLDLPRAILTLRPRLRVCVVMRFHDDLTVPGIARELRLSDDTVASDLAEAIGLLEALLGPLPGAHTIDILSTGPAR